MSVFDFPQDRSNTNSVKWEKTAIQSIAANRNAEPFWVADMDFQAEPHIKKKAEEIASSGVFGYPSFPSFSKVASSWLLKKHNWSVKEEDIVYSMGLLNGVSIAVNLLTEKGDHILIPSPTYRPFRRIAEVNERVMVDHELGYKDGRFFLDRERFLSDAKKSRLILFCSPHNPSGIVFSEDDLVFVLTTAKSLGIPVISDEIHADLVHPGHIHIPMGMANEKVGAETVTLMAPSKTFNVAGEHSAIVVFSSHETRDRFMNVQERLWINEPGHLIGELTETAYSYGLDWNKELCSYLGKNREFISTYLEENVEGVRMVKAEASFVTFLDCSGIYDKVKEKVESDPKKYSSSSGGVLSRFFGVEAGVAMNDGTWFGDQYKAFVRFNYGTSKERIEKALVRMKRAIDSLQD
ncbi:MAG: MalY/PatB family protein [Candidatus Ornithospirochaeta sp.]